jgi:hypothetical protein
VRRLLQDSSMALLSQLIQAAPPAQVARVHRLGSRHDPAIADHKLIHSQLGARLAAGDFDESVPRRTSGSA